MSNRFSLSSSMVEDNLERKKKTKEFYTYCDSV